MMNDEVAAEKMGKPHQQRLEKMRKQQQAQRVDNTVTEHEEKTFIGCPVPDPIICSSPKIEADEENGVKMLCTNDNCEVVFAYVHANCFREFEDSLVRRLNSLGSARGWTDAQRRNNLWEKKGQSLIGKFCRCHCGSGLMTLDKQAAYEKEKAEVKKRKERKNKKELPKLQFVTKNVPADEKMNNSSFDDWSNMTSRTEVNESAIGAKSMDSDRDRLERHASMEKVVLAPPPPAQKRSYASTIKSPSDHDSDETILKDSGVDTRSSSMDSRERDSPLVEKEEAVAEKTPIFLSEKLEIQEKVEQLSPIVNLDASQAKRAPILEFDYWPTIHESPKVSKSATNALSAAITGAGAVPATIATPTYPITSTPKAGREPRQKRRDQTILTPLKIITDIEKMLGNEEVKSTIHFKRLVLEEPQPVEEEEVKKEEDPPKEIVKLEAEKEEEELEGEEMNEQPIIYGWTPFYGIDFNLGERLIYLP